MTKLKAASSRLAFAGARLSTAPEPAKGPTPAIQASAPWKAWYKTSRWAELKQRVHIRDNYTCQRTGVLCAGRYPAPNSPVANHKKPHRGDPDLFWDENNVETVTKAVHDGEVQREEQASRHTIGDWR